MMKVPIRAAGDGFQAMKLWVLCALGIAKTQQENKKPPH
jgi:hypothetical protein